MKWGPDGIRITDEEYNNYAPHVMVTSDNEFIFLNNMQPSDTTWESMLNLQKDKYPDTTLGQEHYIHVFLQKFDLDGKLIFNDQSRNSG